MTTDACARVIRSLLLAVAAAVLAGCHGPGAMQTTPDGKPVSGLAMSEREVQAFIRRAVDPREFAISVALDANNIPLFVNANRPRPGLTAVAPIVSPPYSRLPLIEGEAAGRPVRILIDPTSSANWTSLDRARLFGLMPIGPPLVYGLPEHVPDTVRGGLCVAPSLGIDVMSIDAVLFYARAMRGPLWPLSRSAEAHEADMILGWNFLRAFEYVRWDFPSRMIEFSTRSAGDQEDGRVLARLPLEKGYDAMVVKGTVDGKTLPLLIDLAGDFELAQDEAPSAPIRQISLGDVVLRNVRCATIRELGLGFPGLARLGLRAIGRFSLVLENHQNELWIETPSVRTPAGAGL